VLALGGVAAAAAVNTFSAATGIHVRASDPNARAIGTGHAIALGAPDDVGVGVKLTHDIPFALGVLLRAKAAHLAHDRLRHLGAVRLDDP
jgi:hypothetical protein